MLCHPEDARDASHEILVRVVTHLGSFRGDSGLREAIVGFTRRHCGLVDAGNPVSVHATIATRASDRTGRPCGPAVRA
jgi:hypothetical protein